jgi:predicted RNA-binding protein with PUA-like domain
MMNFWLMKSEPTTYSWSDLKNKSDQRDTWEGVRNYQARNYMKDMRRGDQAFFYHSGTKSQAIMGIIEIVRTAYVDPTQFDPISSYFDPKSKPENPRWIMVDVKHQSEFNPPITRKEIKSIPELQDMILFHNSRLSIQPVTESAWKIISDLR